ncbi:MAG: alpha/beta fold hydrolase [Crocinitomicaceae bacterium]
MSGNEFIGPQPDAISWAPDGKSFFFQWDHDNNRESSYFEYRLDDKKYSALNEQQISELPVNGFLKDPSGTHIYFKNESGVLCKWEKSGIRPLFSFHTAYGVEKIFESGDVLLRLGDQFYTLKPEKSSFLISFTFKNKQHSQQDDHFLTAQQKELFQYFNKPAPKKTQVEYPVISYEKGETISWIESNQSLRTILFESSTYPQHEPTHYMSYVTKDGYAQHQKARPKVGKEDPSHWLYLYQSNADTSIQLDISSLSSVTKKPAYLRLYNKEASEEYDSPKKCIYHSHGMDPSGTYFLVEIKSYDNKDRWITIIDTNGVLTEIDHQHDEAWIGGPGISGWNMVSGNCGWLNANEIYFQSEKTGYSQLYRYDLKSNKCDALTSGAFEIHQAELSKDKRTFFITANKTHPGNRDFYQLDIQQKNLIPILTTEGNHEVFTSPNEQQLAIRYSYKNKPWEIYLSPLKKGAEMQQITESTRKEFREYPWRDPKIITYKAKDSTTIYARLYQPEDSINNKAAILFVHGAGYLQNAHNWWSGYYREYMFNNLLADKGYTVLDIDYRASKGYGRDFRTAIYRNMGGKDLSDHLDGRNYLIHELGIDSSRIGIYGGSYGGFITLMALLKEPGKFKCGAALRSVADWAHYNHEYTSNILNTPATDPEAFEKSSPIYFAENLSDRLLMLHGIEDDNVQYQDVVRLSQRFIELGKREWDLIGYPIEKHGFKETSAWADEYRRILELFEKNLE